MTERIDSRVVVNERDATFSFDFRELKEMENDVKRHRAALVDLSDSESEVGDGRRQRARTGNP